MTALLAIVLGCILLLLFVVFATAKGSVWRGALLTVTLVLALGASAIAVLLFEVGGDSRWRSEGPANVLVMIGLAGAGLLAFLLWSGFLSLLLTPGPRLGKEELERLGRVGRVGCWGLVGSAAVALLAAAAGWVARQPSHDRAIGCLFVSADAAEVLSVDHGGVVKRWDARDGRYRGSARNRGLSGARRILAGPNGHLLAFDNTGAALYESVEARWPLARMPNVTEAAFTPQDEVVTATPSGLVWRALAHPETEARRFPWPLAVLGVAVSPAGETSLLDQGGRVITLAPGLAAVRREVFVGQQFSRIAWAPSGRTLLLVGSNMSAASLDPEDTEARHLDGVTLTRSGFSGPDTVAFELAGLNLVRLGDGEVRNLLPLGRRTRIGSVAASPVTGRVFYAQEASVYLVKPADTDHPAQAVRLGRFRL